MRALTSCVEFGCASQRLEDSLKPLPRMPLAPELAAPLRTRDLESSPNETCAFGKDTLEWPHTPALYDTLTHTMATQANTWCAYLHLGEIWLELRCWLYWLLLLLLYTPTQSSKSPQKRTYLPSELHLESSALCWTGGSQHYIFLDSLTLPVYY